MEVTRSNFSEILEELDPVLENATFLAIDGEFTGLNSGPEAKPFDTPAQYYSKLRSGSMDFLMVQFGLAVFTHNPQTDKYSQRSYNFYVFPRPMNRSAPDCRFMCQASSIDFLASRGFDFNKLFNHGIPYLTQQEEKKMYKKFEDKQKANNDGPEISIPEDDVSQIEEICTKIDEFLSSGAEELSIDRCNAFIRRLVHQEVRMRWPKKVRIEAKTEGGAQTIIVYRMGTKEEEKRREAAKREEEKKELNDAVGITALLRKIADSGKPIVGHNMLLDLLHMIHQFFGPPPEIYREFKSLIHGLFPKLFDLKVICQSTKFKEKIRFTVLDGVLETVSKEPFSIPEIEPIKNRSYSLSDAIYHEAGYDAYVTGLCFIALANYLGSSKRTVLPDSSLLNPYINKLLMVRLKDVPHINLEGNDPIPSRDHVFHLTFPKEWKLGDLTQLFSSYGGVYVSWVNDVTAFVGLNRREHSSSIIKHLAKNKRAKECKIQTYADYQNSCDNDEKSETRNTNDQKHKSSAKKFRSRKDVTSNEKKKDYKSGNGVDNSSKDNESWETAATGRKRRKRKAGGTSVENNSKVKPFTENPSWE